MPAPLLVTHDDTLLDELLRLAAAAGVTPEIARDAATALRCWSAASLVLLGADLAAELAALTPARRAGVHVVAWGAVPDDLFRLALGVGAESVADLPGSEGWVTEALTDLGESGRARGLTLGVLGGSGGAGATTLACAIGQVAAHDGPSLVVDADPLGPGLDRVLGLEDRDGVRWDSLSRAGGRLGARALREALPHRGHLAALTWYAGAPASLDPVAAREALSAARRGHDTVVVDLPRSADPLVEEVLARCDLVLVVAVPTVAGTASAARVTARLADRGRVRLVLRGHGVAPAEVTRVTGVEVLTTMGDQPRLAESIDLGLGPARSRRGRLARAAAEVLARAALMPHAGQRAA